MTFCFASCYTFSIFTRRNKTQERYQRDSSETLWKTKVTSNQTRIALWTGGRIPFAYPISKSCPRQVVTNVLQFKRTYVKIFRSDMIGSRINPARPAWIICLITIPLLTPLRIADNRVSFIETHITTPGVVVAVILPKMGIIRSGSPRKVKVPGSFAWPTKKWKEMQNPKADCPWNGFIEKQLTKQLSKRAWYSWYIAYPCPKPCQAGRQAA